MYAKIFLVGGRDAFLMSYRYRNNMGGLGFYIKPFHRTVYKSNMIVQNVWFQLTSILLLSSMELDQCLPAAIPSLTFKQLPRWSHLFGWTMLVIALPINNDGLTIREGMKELLGQTASGVTTLQWRSIGIWLTVVSLAITTFRLTKRYFIKDKVYVREMNYI